LIEDARWQEEREEKKKDEEMIYMI